ncbi:MAG TPA: TonB-dependent receptor [Gammaproteobacteria bacterium]
MFRREDRASRGAAQWGGSLDARNRGGVLRAAVSLALASAAVGVAHGQEPPAAIEEIQVTGTRIQRTGMTTPTPVTVMTADELEYLAPGTLMDSLDQLPLFMNNNTVETAGSWTTVGGQSTLNLRGVGSNRTLVLLDGRRVVPSNRLSTVDINMFPQMLIERTEVVTGGASAAYGSDAITGVTNFIIDSDFTGFSSNLQGGISDVGDNENTRASFAGGFPVGERSHVVVGAEYYRAEGIPNYDDRDWFDSWGTINFGTNAAGEPNVLPQRIRVANVKSRTYTYGGLIRTGPLAGIQFLEDGTPAEFCDGEILDSGALRAQAEGEIAGSQVGGCGDQRDRDDMVLAGQERGSLFARASIDIGEDTQFYVQGLYGYNKIENAKFGYVFTTPWALTIYDDNPFLPEEIRTRMQEEGIESFQLHKQIPERDPLNNAKAPLTGDMVSITAAVEGGLGERWRYNAYYQYGAANRDLELYGFRVDRFFRGVDAIRDLSSGEIICASTLIQPDDGCVPINVFGLGNESQAARDWVHDSMWLNADVTQHAAEFMVDGEVAESWAGPIFVATGTSWREDRLDQVGGNAGGSPIPVPPNGPVTAFDEDGNLLYRGLPPVYEGYNLIDRAGGPTIKGGFSVWEVFGETSIPLARDAAGAQALDLSLATRFADYEGSGGVWAWKVGLDWQITDAWRFRLTRSRDIRAGSLSERFDVTSTGANITDRFLPDEPTYTIRTVIGGNPEVEPENSDTITFGFVFQPVAVPGLGLSVDYYDIKINGAISQIGNQRIMDYCFEFGSFCDQIVRAPDGTVDSIFNVYINVDEARTRGVDIETSYRRGIGAGDLVFRAVGSYLTEASTTPFDSPKIDRAGEAGVAPPWNVTLVSSYRRGPLSLGWTERWVSSAKVDALWQEGIDIDDNTVPSHSVSNFRVTYDLDRQGRTYSVYGMVTNVFDENPGKLMGLPSIYSVVGRTYTVGFNFRN